MPTVCIETHGCKLNQADSALLARQFIEAGFRVASSDEPADVYVANTCTVTHVADRKARHALRAARRRNPRATIVATGCYAQRSPAELRELDGVDLVVGNSGKSSLVRQVMDWRGEAPVPCAVGTDEGVSTSGVARTRAMVKIQEGCDQVCSYCIVPRVRGRERSIAPNDILGEIHHYVAQGCREVVLTGTQLGSYGFDIPEMDLTRLLELVLSETDVERLRVSSLQPQDISMEMLELWADPRLCPHFHLPLQSGSDTVLRRMRRRYTAGLYSEAVEMVRRTVPDVGITADVISGFPGETEEEFAETLALCERVGFADMHVFPYSVRPGTSAAYFEGRVDPDVKSRRARALLDLARRQAFDFREKFVGSVRPVLWQGSRETDGLMFWSGLTDNYIRVVGRSRRRLANRVTPARLGRQEEDLVHAQVL